MAEAILSNTRHKNNGQYRKR